MTPPPTSIDGTDITGATIDGQEVQEITVDGQTVFSFIPDRGDLHARYDARQLSLSDGDPVTTWPDETGNGNDLTAGTAPVYKTNVIDGQPAVRFDSTNNEFLTASFSTLSQPNHIFVLCDHDSDEGNVVDSTDSNNRHALGTNNGDWLLFAGDTVSDGPRAAGFEIVGGLFDGGNSVIRVDGIQEGSGNAGGDGMNGMTVGAQQGPILFIDVDIVEILVYSTDKSSIVSEVETHLDRDTNII
jgi:hypothetical protein